MSFAPWLTARSGAPKGPAAWTPKGRHAAIAQDVLDVVAMLREADALPVGPRTIAYRLSMRDNASGTHYRKTNPTKKVVDGWATFEDVNDVVKRLRQCGRLPWAEVSDGSSVHHPVPGFDSVDDWASNRLDPDTFSRDLRDGQPVVVEIYAESAELTPLIARVAVEYGVRTYSGRGSGGPDLARKAAARAWNRYNDDRGPTDHPRLRKIAGTRTLLLGIGDLDYAGVTGVMRPHVEHVGAFLAGWAGNGTAAKILDFSRLAITPEQAIEINEALGIDPGASALYRDSGGDDWSRDPSLLNDSPKTEVEALDPTSLRGLIREALHAALDLDEIERVRDEEQSERGEIPAMRDKLGLLTNEDA